MIKLIDMKRNPIIDGSKSCTWRPGACAVGVQSPLSGADLRLCRELLWRHLQEQPKQSHSPRQKRIRLARALSLSQRSPTAQPVQEIRRKIDTGTLELTTKHLPTTDNLDNKPPK